MPIAVACNTISPLNIDTDRIDVEVEHSIPTIVRPDGKFIVSPGASNEGNVIAVTGLEEALISGGMLSSNGNFFEITCEGIEDSPTHAIALVHGFAKVRPVTPHGMKVLASKKSEDGSTAYVIQLKNGCIFEAEVKIKGEPYGLKFISEDGCVKQYVPRSQRGSTGDDDKPYGDPGGSVLAPIKKGPPPRVGFAENPFE